MKSIGDIMKEIDGANYSEQYEILEKWQEATGETETLPDLGDLLDWLMARGTKAEAELSKWTRKHDDVDLQELREQFKNSYSLGAQRAYINGLECHLRQAKERGTELDNLFDIQQTRMGEATKLWQEATGETETLPDLGELLDWLMERGTDAEAKVKQLEKNLKKAMNDLRDMSNIKYQFAPAYLFIDMANKALADIEGEPYRHQGVSSDHTGASNKPEQIHADWESLKECVTGLDKWIKDDGIPRKTAEDYLNIAKCTLWLKEQIAEINNTLSDVQAEVIGLTNKSK